VAFWSEDDDGVPSYHYHLDIDGVYRKHVSDAALVHVDVMYLRTFGRLPVNPSVGSRGRRRARTRDPLTEIARLLPGVGTGWTPERVGAALAVALASKESSRGLEADIVHLSIEVSPGEHPEFWKVLLTADAPRTRRVALYLLGKILTRSFPRDEEEYARVLGRDACDDGKEEYLATFRRALENKARDRRAHEVDLGDGRRLECVPFGHAFEVTPFSCPRCRRPLVGARLVSAPAPYFRVGDEERVTVCPRCRVVFLTESQYYRLFEWPPE